MKYWRKANGTSTFGGNKDEDVTLFRHGREYIREKGDIMTLEELFPLRWRAFGVLIVTEYQNKKLTKVTN